MTSLHPGNIYYQLIYNVGMVRENVENGGESWVKEFGKGSIHPSSLFPPEVPIVNGNFDGKIEFSP